MIGTTATNAISLAKYWKSTPSEGKISAGSGCQSREEQRDRFLYKHYTNKLQCRSFYLARIARFLKNDRPTIYHVISRSALPGLPIQANDKDYLLNLVRRLGKLYFVDVLGFALMDNHFI